MFITVFKCVVYENIIQYQKQKLQILKEVKGHFEKAVNKIEEKYDEGEEDISQSEITKLKLGLAGTLNDIYEIETDLQISRLSLSEILDNQYPPNAQLLESDIIPVEFEFDSFFSWLKHQSIDSKINKNLGSSFKKLPNLGLSFDNK